MQVDELCSSQNARTRGAGATDALILQHEGFSLYPAADQMQDLDVDCAAYLVPLSMLDAAEGESSDSD